jgi:GT2 family glycosyltransferase
MALDVSVCVPVYRTHAEPNVRTLAAALPAALGRLDGELVVALNGISAEQAGVPPDAHTVDLVVNRGVSPGWNAAAGAATAPVLVFANDDVVPGPGALELLHDKLLSREEAGVVSVSGSLWDLAGARHEQHVELSQRPPGELVPCDVAGGFLFAMRRSTWERLRGFDEFYAPCSWEEVDFSTALQVELGLRCYALAGVPHDHEWGISQPQRPWRRMRFDGRSESIWRIHRRNRRHYVSKWRDRLRAARRTAT